MRLEGPSVRRGRIKLADFLQLGQEIIRVVDRIAFVLAGHSDSRKKGRRTQIQQSALSLDLVAFTHGSPSAVALFDRSDDQTLLKPMDSGLQVYECWLHGLRYELNETEPLPSGYDIGVLMAIRDMGSLFDRGITCMEFHLNHRIKPLKVVYDPPSRERIVRRIRTPEAHQNSYEGRLMMVDFKEEGSRIRVEPSAGPAIPCLFDDVLKDAVYDNILKFVRVSGTVQKDAAGRVTAVKMTDIMPIEETRRTGLMQEKLKAPPPGEFWTTKTLDDLAEEQGVATISSLDKLMGGWPEDEMGDGFENAVARWRSEDSRMPATS